MVNHRPPLDATFSALADPTRRTMLERLQCGATTVGELAAPFAMSLPAVSKHLRVLERSGLVRRDVRGREHYIALDAPRLAEAMRWLGFFQKFWDERLDALARHVAIESSAASPKEDPSWPARPPTPRSGSNARSRRRASGSSRPGRPPKR